MFFSNLESFELKYLLMIFFLGLLFCLPIACLIWSMPTLFKVCSLRIVKICVILSHALFIYLDNHEDVEKLKNVKDEIVSFFNSKKSIYLTQKQNQGHCILPSDLFSVILITFSWLL